VGDLEPHARRIGLALTGVVHRQHERVDVRQGPGEGIGDVGRGCRAAFRRDGDFVPRS
jgi:hypothetical protein